MSYCSGQSDSPRPVLPVLPPLLSEKDFSEAYKQLDAIAAGDSMVAIMFLTKKLGKF